MKVQNQIQVKLKNEIFLPDVFLCDVVMTKKTRLYPVYGPIP